MIKSTRLLPVIILLTYCLLGCPSELISQNYYEDSYTELKDSLYYTQIDNYLNNGEYDSLVGLSNEAFDFYYKLGETDRANYLFNVCVYYPLVGPFGDTLMQLIDNKIAFLREYTDTLNVHFATLLHIKSFGCKYFGQYSEAIPYMENAVAIYKQVETPLLHISSGYYNLAGLRFYEKRIIESYELYKNSLIGFNSVNPEETQHFTWIKIHDAGSAYIGLALSMRRTQQIELAAAFDKKAFQILQSYYPDSDVTATAMINLASDYLKLGDYPQAIEFATLTEDWITEHEAYDRFYDEYHLLHVVRGNASRNMEDYTSAFEDFQALEAHVVQQYRNDSLQRAEVYGLMADNFSRQNMLDSALVYYAKALSYNPASFSTHSSMAQTYALAGMTHEAISNAEINLKSLLNSPLVDVTDIIPVADSLSDDFLGYQTASTLARDYFSLYNQSKNPTQLTQSLRFASLADTLIGRCRDATLIGGNDRQLAKDYHQLAETGIKASFEAYEKKSAQADLNNLLQFFTQSTAYKLNAEVNQTGSRSDLSTRQIVLLQNIRHLENQLQVLDKNPDSLLESQLFEQLIADRMEAFELSYSLQNTDQHAELNELFSRITFLDIQQQLSDKEGVLAYFMADDQLFSLFVGKYSTKVIAVAKGDRFDLIVTQYYKGLKTGATDFAQTSTELYGYLLSPFEKELADLENLIIIPDGELSQIPFEALIHPGGQEFLIEKTAISYNYSVFLWLKSRQAVHPDNELSFVGFAPVFSDGGYQIQPNTLLADLNFRDSDSSWRSGNKLRELPFSKEEVVDIAHLFDEKGITERTFLNQEASEENLKNNINQFDIIHIATHGISSNINPELSGLFLDQTIVDTVENITNDGFLYLGELFTLPVKANLVVLSACKTGAGKLAEGEGVLALPRGFIFAGVPNLVVSLWKIHDQKTKALMVDFYTQILDGQPYSRALQQAKIIQIKQGQLPMDWSGIVLIGK